MPFTTLGLSPDILAAVASLGYEEPFPIQASVIPLVLAGRDVVALAKTGTGKTMAFALPIAQRLGGNAKREGNSIRVLVLVPTRELAAQVSEVMSRLCAALRAGLRVRIAFGGVSVNPQMLALRGGADILVATPGRLLDLVRRNSVRLSLVDTLVLDEADRMLDLGFGDEMGAILASLPARRQTLLFSATFDPGLEHLVSRNLRNPARIGASAGGVDKSGEDTSGVEKPGLEKPTAEPRGRSAGDDAGDIEERVYRVARDDKGPFLHRLIQEGGWERVLVFASSTRRADNVARKLNNNGIPAESLHGDKSQGARTKALSDFRSGATRVLVASDLASRGLDIDRLPCVVNYELPRSPLDYVHRIGRTGRAGKKGLAVSLVAEDEKEMLRLIEKRLGRRLPLSPPGTEGET